MTSVAGAGVRPVRPDDRGDPVVPVPPRTLVWLDAREAVVARWCEGATSVERVESDVPPHHRGTEHVRHDPRMRHGGGGPAQTAGEPNRLEHLARFVAGVAERLPADDDLLIIGPGTVHERLARFVRDRDRRHGSHRGVTVERADRLTERQVLARLRAEAGAAAPRWTADAGPAGRRVPGPRHAGRRPPPIDDE